MKPNTVKRIFKYLLSLALAAVLLYFSFKGVKWEDFVLGLKGCNWGFVVLSMVAGVPDWGVFAPRTWVGSSPSLASRSAGV